MKLVRRICVLLILLAITIGLMSAANAQTLDSIYDTNADGKVDLLDVTQTQRWFGTDYAPCDVDRDGEVSITDMISIANAMEGKPSADTSQPTAVLAVEDTTLATTQYTIDFDFVIEKDNQGFCFGMSDTSNFIMWQVDTFVGGDKVLLRPHFKFGGMWKGYPGQAGYNVQNVDITSAFGVSSASEVIGKTFHERIVVNGANVKTYFGAAGATADTPDSELILANNFTYNGATSLPFNGIGFRHVDDGAGNAQEISSYDNIVVRNENGEIIFSEDFSDPNRIQITNTNSKIPYAVENGSLQVGGVDDSVNSKGEAVFKLDQLASPESFKTYTVSASNAANLATVQLRLKYSGLTELVVEPAGE